MGVVVHEFTRIYTNWRLVCSALLFKTVAGFVIGKAGSIEHFVLGSMLAVASRSIACFASLEYRFAVEEKRLDSWMA